ncbi:MULTISPECIES: hypothetical protein [unclassified Rhodococcus (in: high G+C Gram-positive bacteria)]|uniref:hypothetical protein n=1 Tax=unclassified Rhodococcus (in: high G+C Gram-positive bacteria) TaxID=192944 RepID=UPI0012F4919C|nr:hypothetical protein [Rhodococcus sp. YL-1]
MHKEQRRLVAKLHDAGYVTRRTSRQHLLVLHDGQIITCFAGTPSDFRSWRNSLAPLRASVSVHDLYEGNTDHDDHPHHVCCCLVGADGGDDVVRLQ